MWQSVLIRAIRIPIRKRILELYDRGRSTREIAQFSGFASRRCGACASSFGSVARWSRRRTCADARHCSPKSGSSDCGICYRSSPMPRWPSWARGWTGRFAPPRSISGCGGWVGSLKETLAAAEQKRPDVAAKRARWHKQLAAEPPAHLVFLDESGANTKMTRLRGGAGWAKTVPTCATSSNESASIPKTDLASCSPTNGESRGKLTLTSPVPQTSRPHVYNRPVPKRPFNFQPSE